MNLLAIDSASSVLSVALSCADEIHCTESEAGTKHSELVMELIDSQMKKARLLPEDLDGVLCMGGPGSFTGLRIAYSIAKGLALSLSIPFAPVPTLDCMAFPCRGSVPVLAVIEARKKTFFYSFYRTDELEAESILNEDAQASRIALDIERYGEKIILTGTGAASLYDSFSAETKKSVELDIQKRGYSGEIIAIAKMRKIMDNDNTAFLYSGPEYIRKTDAELNLLNAGN
jgi:tRNA threonylcarbamoyladenosine biosynthesis protein TsaB